MEPEFVSWRGHRVHVKVTGQGDPPLLLIHGPRRQHRHVDAVRPAVPEPPHHPLRRARNRAVERAVLAGLGRRDRRARRGHAGRTGRGDAPTSSGSPTAAPWPSSWPFSYPDRVRRLVLAATNCGLGAVPGSFAAMASLATPLRYYSPTYFDRNAAASRTAGMTGRDLSMRRRMMAERHRHPPSAYGYSMQLLGTIGWSSLPFLSRIPHDTLVISRRRRSVDPDRERGDCWRAASRARAWKSSNRSGHLFLWDEAKRMAVRIARFLDSHAGAAPSPTRVTQLVLNPPRARPCRSAAV